jgi:hypothetical protein
MHGGSGVADDADRQARRLLAASLAAAEQGRLKGGRSFAPLPVMGIPGWCDENADPVSTTLGVFRPGRRGAAANAEAG